MRDIYWQDYMASTLYVGVKMISSIGGHQWEAPSWMDMMYNDSVKDERSAEQIKADIVAAMIGGDSK